MDCTHRIRFEKPDLDDLNRRFAVVDMHFHTRHSDGKHTTEQIAAQARHLGIGVAVTDHNTIRGALEMDRQRDVFSIPGIEVTSREGAHLLVYFNGIESLGAFFDNHIGPHRGSEVMSSIGLEMEEIVSRARRYRSLVILAHPYCAIYTGVCNLNFPPERLERLFAAVDGVEAINAGNMSRWNLQCAVLGFNLGKAVTGGSDGHSRQHLGRAVSYADCPRERRTFLDAVRRGRSRVVGKEIAMLRKMSSSGTRLRSSIRNYPDIFEKNLRYGRMLLHSKSRALRDNVYAALIGKL
jgi:predicted metal-dependent phosphoesterase TrpH